MKVLILNELNITFYNNLFIILPEPRRVCS